MVICAVFGCNNRTRKRDSGSAGRHISFLTFPKDENLCSIWVQFCKRSDKFNVKNSRVCSEHFEEDVFHWNLQHKLLGYSPKRSRKVKPGCVPTLKSPSLKAKDSPYPEVRSSMPENNERTARKEHRAKRKLVDELTASTFSCQPSISTCIDAANERHHAADHTINDHTD
jgi:THAP domain